MSQHPMSRPTITDDDGSGATGTIYNAGWFDDLFDRIDAMITWVYQARTSVYSIQPTDDFIDVLSGSFTLTLHAANDATRSYNPLYVANGGSGIANLDGDGYLIAGFSDIDLAPGDGLMLLSNGSAWRVF